MARPFVPAFLATILVIMQLLKAPVVHCASILYSGQAVAKSTGVAMVIRESSNTKSRRGLFLSRQSNLGIPDAVAKFNEKALALRKKIDQLELHCKIAQMKDKETIAGLNRELRLLSGQMAGNVAAHNSASSAAEQEKAQAVKLRAQLADAHRTCQSMRRSLNTSIGALEGDRTRATLLRDLATGCEATALAAIRTSRSAAQSLPAASLARTSLLQGCADEVVAPMLAARKALSRDGRNFTTAFASKVFDDALRGATRGSTFPVSLVGDKDWPSRQQPRSTARAKASSSCKLPKGAVNCGLLKARLDAMASRLHEQRNSAVTEQRKTVESCVAREQQLNDRIRTTESQYARSSAALARLTGEKASFAASRATIVQRLRRAEEDSAKFRATCETGIDEYQGELDDVFEERQVVADKVAGKKQLIQDCSVTDWKFSKCSKACKENESDTVGHMNATRDVEQGPGLEGHECPPLLATLPCNDKPCPQHCKVSEWAKWSTCSKACGGGTTNRIRTVIAQAKDGGKSCPNIEQRKICNIGSCSDECTLKEWSPWSACSRRCKFSKSSPAGRSTRTREIRGDPVKSGGGSPCPLADDKSRLEVRACNGEICPASMVCNASQDVVLLLDGSAGHGHEFESQLKLTRALAASSRKSVRFGVVAYGQQAKVLSRITDDRASLSPLLSAKPPGGKRDVTQGEMLGRTLFLDPGVGKGRPKTVVLLLGGTPAAFVEAKKASEDLRSAGIRVVVGLVDDGDSLARKQACGLASEPCSANVEAVRSWEQLAEEPGRFLASVCNGLVYSAPE